MDLTDVPSSFPSPTPGVHLLRRMDLLRAGYDVDAIRRGLRQQELVRVAPGRYHPAGLDLSTAESHRLLILSVADRNRTAVVSHRSAAVLHGIPLLLAPGGRVHATREGRTGARRNKWIEVHSGRLNDDDMVITGGVQVTTIGRTLVDLARTADFEEAVVAVDFALHHRLITPAELASVVHRMDHARWMPKARRSILFADGRSESVGESRCRVALHRARIPTPELQVEVRSAGGVFLGRSDFGWIEQRSLLEFDGRIKYSTENVSGRTGVEVLMDEKRREDAIRACGCAMCRAVWADLKVPDRLQSMVGAVWRAGQRFLGSDELGTLTPAPAIRVRL